jgi:Undecaprenyl-phosphate galactose phosphotransferase WbaP
MLVKYKLNKFLGWMETLTLIELTKLLKNEAISYSFGKNTVLRKILATFFFLLSDISMLTLSILVSFALTVFAFETFTISWNHIYLLCLSLPFFPIAYALRGLYPGFGIDIIEELRSITYSTTIAFIIFLLLSYLAEGIDSQFRITVLASFFVALATVPVGRSVVRKLVSNRSWWGIPVVVIGAGRAGERVISSLIKQKQLGLRPIVAVDDDVDRWGYIQGVPVVGGLDIIPDLSQRLCNEHAIIAMPRVNIERQKEIINKYSKFFAHTTIIPDLYGLSSLWVSVRDFGGVLGLELQQKLLSSSARFMKRLFDIVLGTILLVLSAPLMLIIALLVKLDSRGKVLFKQERMGINDTRFNIIKFRTMHNDAEERLASILSSNPELRKEYEIYHKLKDDPRLTRVGKFLRKYSLDELPQFWNVIKGDMSLIGPRAYIPWEKIKMNGHEEMILKVKPGISGLWQVTDRNNSSFEERNQMDVYYIRNWSMFLDIYIVARTIAVVLTGRSGC